jgi:hypothetical protein
VRDEGRIIAQHIHSARVFFNINPGAIKPGELTDLATVFAEVVRAAVASGTYCLNSRDRRGVGL